MPRTTTGLPAYLPFASAAAALVALGGCLPVVAIDHHQEVWTSVAIGAQDDLTAVQFLDLTTGYAIGDHGTVLKTTDGGATWTRLVPTAVAGKKLLGLSFLDAAQGFAISETSLYKTADGGATWAELYDFRAKHQDPPRAVKFVTASAGYVTCNKAIYQTLDGSSWTKANVPQGSAVEANGATVYVAGYEVYTSQLTNVYVGVPGAGKPCTGFGDCGAAIHFPSATDGWIFGSTGNKGDGLTGITFRRTRDGGQTWTTGDPNGQVGAMMAYAGTRAGLYPPRLRFTTADHGWLLVDGDLMATHDGGTTWKRQVQFRNPDKFDKEALTKKNDDLFDVSAPDATHAWMVGAGGRVYKWENRYYPPYLDGDAPLSALWDPRKR